MAFSNEQLTTMRQTLGLAADADEATIVAAIAEVADEKDDAPAGADLPDGVTVIDSATLTALQASARRGDEAAKRQEREDREALVTNAVADGRVAPARREAWLNALAADPGAADTLAKLEKGLVPVDERGHAGEVRDDVAASVDDITQSDLYKNWIS